MVRGVDQQANTTRRQRRTAQTTGIAIVPQASYYKLDYTDLAAAATAATVTFVTLPPGAVVFGAKIKHRTAFGGGGIGSYTIEIGITGSLDKYMPAFNVFQAVSNTALSFDWTPDAENHGVDTEIKATARADIDTDNATQGQVEIWLFWALCK